MSVVSRRRDGSHKRIYNSSLVTTEKCSSSQQPFSPYHVLWIQKWVKTAKDPAQETDDRHESWHGWWRIQCTFPPGTTPSSSQVRPETLRSDLFQEIKARPRKNKLQKHKWELRNGYLWGKLTGLLHPQGQPRSPPPFHQQQRGSAMVKNDPGLQSPSSATPISVTLDFCKWEQFLTYWDSED